MPSDRQWTPWMVCAASGCPVPVIVPWAFRASVDAIICAEHREELTEQEYEAIVRERIGE